MALEIIEEVQRKVRKIECISLAIQKDNKMYAKCEELNMEQYENLF